MLYELYQIRLKKEIGDTPNPGRRLAASCTSATLDYDDLVFRFAILEKE
jgi:hypothetical protein